jgi:signal transduction histidine kinase/DNA-binding response OmpR family regulator
MVLDAVNPMVRGAGEHDSGKPGPLRIAMPETTDRVDILLVDDQASNLAALELILEPLGQNLHRAQSGRDALRMLLERDFAVILLDVKMPVLDGFETAKLIRERKRSAQTPIIFLTAVAEEKVQLFQAYSLGAVDYLVKPFEATILQAKVSAFVEMALNTRQVMRSLEALRRAEAREHERELMQQKMESALSQQRWLEAILDVMPTPLMLLDPAQPAVVFANRAARALAGGALATLEPPEGVRFMDSEGRALRAEELPAQRAVQGETLAGLELDFEGPDFTGSVLTYSERLGASFGHAETLLLTLLDISVLKMAEEELRAALRAREDFLAVGSHELRTPLTALKLQLGNALRGLVQPPPTATAQDHSALFQRHSAYLRQMQASVDRLTRLSDYLLDVTRLTTRSLELNLTEMDLGDLAKEIAGRFQPELTHASCELRVVQEGAVTGRWDRPRLDQVITNLLANAIRYAPGKPIQLDLRAGGGTALLVVRDQGPGIPADRLPVLFQKFERAVESDDGRGFGLGLWIVQQIVSMHGGTVEVESQLGVGTTFTVTLPQDALAVGKLPPQPEAPMSGNGNVVHG